MRTLKFVAVWLAILMLLFWCGRALSHDAAKWIEDGRYRGTDDVGCCGPRDCEPIDGDRIEIHRDGFYLKDFDETVPFADAKPSEDKHAWRCKIPVSGIRRCFFFNYGAS